MEDLKTKILSGKLPVLLIEERANTDNVIGALHHSRGGVKERPCSEYKNADEAEYVVISCEIIYPIRHISLSRKHNECVALTCPKAKTLRQRKTTKSKRVY